MEIKRKSVAPVKKENNFRERMALARKERRGPTRDEEGLTDKERRFVEHYFTTFSPQAACKAVGYGAQYYEGVEKPDKVKMSMVASHVMRNDYVSRAIQKRRDEFKEKIELRQEDVLYELSAIAQSRLTDYFDIVDGKVEFKDFRKLTDAQKAAIEGISFLQTSRPVKRS